MHDHTYRMGICWQNTAYNQPPHLGYYLPDYISGKLVNAIPSVPAVPSVAKVSQPQQVFALQGRQHSGLRPGLNIIREGGKVRKFFISNTAADRR